MLTLPKVKNHEQNLCYECTLHPENQLENNFDFNSPECLGRFMFMNISFHFCPLLLARYGCFKIWKLSFLYSKSP